MNLSLDQKIAGVLVPIFALRGHDDLGIGDTAALREFIDWSADVGFSLVKILPINETGNDNSPYNAISSVALDPTTIHLTPAALEDLRASDYESLLATRDEAKVNSTTVDYTFVKPLKRHLLEAAFRNFSRRHPGKKTERARAFAQFLEAEKSWLENYTLFRALMERNNGSEQWDLWPEAQQDAARARAWLDAQSQRTRESIVRLQRFFAYVQWIAFTQWREVKAHADRRGVALMGDIPFGVSYYSADVFAHRELFRTGWSGGTPPDKIFKHDQFVQQWGQNWGIPLYDWDAARAENFRWWRQRVRGVREFFHLFRIDHVLGFYRIYGFPWRPDQNASFLPLSIDQARERTGGSVPGFQPRPDGTAEEKAMNCKEGEEFLRVIIDEAGAGRVIGEDLGEVPDYVRPNLTALGIAGYKIPQWEKQHDGRLISGEQYQRLSLATYGTHDHDPLQIAWDRLSKEAGHSGEAAAERTGLAQYAGLDPQHLPGELTPELHRALLAALLGSNSWIAVIMITDLFGRRERFNLPGVATSANWSQRIHVPVSELAADPMVPQIRQLLRETGRAAAV